MNKKERIIIAMILLGISVMTLVDLITDSREGVSWWHTSVEGFIAVAALFGGSMDQLFNKLGLPRSGLTAQQRLLPIVSTKKLVINFSYMI